MSTLFALSLALPTVALPTDHKTAIAPSWVSSPDVRGTGDIVFTCLAAISLCVYTALHLNVPKRGSTAVDDILRKAKWVVVGIFAPEVVVYSAFLQLRTVVVFRTAMRKILQEADLEVDKESTGSSTQKTNVLDQDHQPSIVEKQTGEAMEMNAQESDPMMRYMVNGQSTASKGVLFPDNQVSWAYAWYVIMGGFVLDVSPLHDYHGVMTLTHHAVLRLAKDGLLLPMPDDSIHDNSKADYLAKALVFLQVSFLVVQTIARKSQALPITLLEIHALVHVVCAAGMYVAWFGKPLDIKDPLDISHNVWSNPVISKGLQWQKITAEMLVRCPLLKTWSSGVGGWPLPSKEECMAMNYGPFLESHDRQPQSLSLTSLQRDGAQLLDPSFDGLPFRSCTKELVSAIVAWDLNGNRTLHGRISDEFYICASGGSRPPVALSLISGCALGSGVGPTVYPSSLLKFYFTQKALKWWMLAFDARLDYLHQATGEGPFVRHVNKKISSFGQPYLETRMSSFAARSTHHDKWTALLACATCIAYGGIHATGWNFVFATQTEQLLWRISCPLLVIFGLPMYSFVSAVEGEESRDMFGKLKQTWRLMLWDIYHYFREYHFVVFLAFSRWLSILCFLPYCAARIFLVVEAFISLRHVPEGVYQVANWTNYIPHL